MQTLQMAEQILTVYRINCFRSQGALHNKKVCKRKEMYITEMAFVHQKDLNLVFLKSENGSEMMKVYLKSNISLKQTQRSVACGINKLCSVLD